MAIEFNGSPDELSSPFCDKNHEICSLWENYILSRSGTVRGKYNAWSFKILGEFENNWQIEIKKSSMSGGNLLLNTEYQNLLVRIELKKSPLTLDTGNFFVRRINYVDWIKGVFLNDLRLYSLNKKYLIISNKESFEGRLFNDVLDIFQPSIRSNEFDEMKYNIETKEFRVSMKSIAPNFELIDKVLRIK